MEIKIKDSKKEEKYLRKERRRLRLDLETLIGVKSSKYIRIIKRLKEHLRKTRERIKKKYKIKIERYLEEKKQSY